MKRILFVCMGNICRSPTGEGVFRKHVEDLRTDQEVFVDSAGTIDYHVGKPADRRMQAAARQRGYRLESIARQVQANDLLTFDLVIAMDRENLADLQRLRDSLTTECKATLALLSDFLGDEWPTDVPDPYNGGDAGFRYVVEMIESACPRIHDKLLSL